MATTSEGRKLRALHLAPCSHVSFEYSCWLQVRSDDRPEKISSTSALICSTAHVPLDELKRIIGVLRGSDTGGEDAGWRSITEIGDLVDAARSAWCRVTLVQDIHSGVVGDLTSHTAYRIVQKALTDSQSIPRVPPSHYGDWGGHGRH